MPECLDSMPWRSIKGCGNMASSMFNLGDYKNDVLKDGTPVRFQIIGFDHDVTPGDMICPITFDMVDCLYNRYSMNGRDTNEGSWERSMMRQVLNNLDGKIYRLLPDEIVELAEPVVKLTADTYNGENTIIKTVDKFFLSSEKERFGRCFYSASGEGRWYEFYRQEDVPWHKLRSGSPDDSWLRSPCAHYSSSFCCVHDGGDASGYSASRSGGVSPSFAF